MNHPLLDRLEAAVARRPQHRAAADAALSLDYAGFHAVACGLAAQIDAATQRPHVGVMAPTSTAGALAIFACWYAGRVPVPLNFLLVSEELGRIIADAGLDLVLTIDRFAPALAAAPVRPLVLAGATTLVPGRRAAPSARPEDLAVMLYTSGTLAEPKGVCLTFGNLCHNIDACLEHAQIHPDHVFLGVLPQFHSFGFTTLTVLPPTLGATVHYQPRFSPVAIIETIAAQRVTAFFAIPSMLGALAQLKHAEPAALASLELTVSGGEPLSPRIAALFEERFRKPIYEGYGMTETSPVATLNTPKANRPGSVGRALPGMTIAAVDPRGAALPAGAEGELTIAGPSVMRGYWNKPQETARVLRDGVLYSGDLGRVDADGFVHITGRAKDMIIVAGENVFPREIESVLLDHPAVAEAAVIGQRDELRGELPLAYVILKAGMSASETELREFCRARLAGYKVPREIRFATDLPRTATGKILKRALQ